MFGRHFKYQHKNRPIDAATINRPVSETARHARLRVGSGMAQVEIAGIPRLRGTGSVATNFWASLTAHVSGGAYDFNRLAENGAVLVTTSQTGVAYDVNGNATISLPVIVRVFLDSSTGVYRFQIHSCN